MFLIDTNVISELRKKNNINTGVSLFFKEAQKNNKHLYLSAITIGEIRRGIDIIYHRGDTKQANNLQQWLEVIITDYCESILDFSYSEALIWGKLRVPNHENTIDKQIAATALSYDLTLVTRNTSDFLSTGVKLINPFD